MLSIHVKYCEGLVPELENILDDMEAAIDNEAVWRFPDATVIVKSDTTTVELHSTAM